MKSLYDVPAPAKLNLFLHITGQREDGYHLIQSVFMLIDWCDTLHFERRNDGLITRTDVLAAGDLALPTEDLTVRAARALQAACGTPFGADIRLEKRIPAQAGMGGGSSDAASCLLALQRLWGVKLPRDKLMEIALSLGADVPFFLCGGNGWVEGVGDKITPIPLPAADFVVVKPAQGLETKAIFSSGSLKRDSETATIEGFLETCRDHFFHFGRNDLQPVASQLCADVSRSLDWLASNNLMGRMTGSGSAVFAQLKQDAIVSNVPHNWRVRKCSGLQAHPLAGW